MSVYLGLDPGGIVTCELLFSGCRDQDVAVGFQNVPFVGFGSWEAHNGAMLLQNAQTHKRKILTCSQKDLLTAILLSENESVDRKEELMILGRENRVK